MEQGQQPFGAQLNAGDAWTWLICLPEYPSSEYTIQYSFRGPGKLDVTATADADSADTYQISVPGATVGEVTGTGDLPPGSYAWALYAFDANQNRTTLDQGQVEVLPDLASLSQQDTRSFAKKNLDMIEAVLLNRNGRVEQSYQINGRQLSLLAPDKLRTEWGYWKAQYMRELIAAGVLPEDHNVIKPSFVTPGGPSGVWR